MGGGISRRPTHPDCAHRVDAGDRCPSCLKGKVYRQKDPARRIRVAGQAPIEATVYELERLRCNLCGDLFEAEAGADPGSSGVDAVELAPDSRAGRHGLGLLVGPVWPKTIDYGMAD
jgi:hypothetical protein